MRRAVILLLTLSFPVAAFAQTVASPDICANYRAELSARMLQYQKCIARYAKKYEVAGDDADRIATAAVSECVDFRQPVADLLDLCGGGISGNRDGERVLAEIDPNLHDFGVTAVIRYRSERLQKSRLHRARKQTT